MAKVQKLVVDAGPLLTQSRDELKSAAEELYTTPEVFSEIKDETARQRLALWREELHIQSPSADAIKFVSAFAKKTGDATVLSAPDIGIIALTYDLHSKEGLKSAPQVFDPTMKVVEHQGHSQQTEEQAEEQAEEQPDQKESEKPEDDEWAVVKPKQKGRRKPAPKKIVPKEPEVEAAKEKKPETNDEEEDDDDSDWSDDGWITTENLKEQLEKDSAEMRPIDKPVSAALASRDFAVQNVCLQIGMDVINDNGLRVTQLKTFMQRCHACFHLLPMPKEGSSRQFCPRCGGHTLTRVTVTIENGEIHVHLKANMQWKTRGDRYSLPNPQSRRARRDQHDAKVEYYAEDQPEYAKAVKLQQRKQRQNEKLIADWVGPSTGDSGASPFVGKRNMTSRVKIGRGRNANAS